MLIRKNWCRLLAFLDKDDYTSMSLWQRASIDIEFLCSCNVVRWLLQSSICKRYLNWSHIEFVIDFWRKMKVVKWDVHEIKTCIKSKILLYAHHSPLQTHHLNFAKTSSLVTKFNQVISEFIALFIWIFASLFTFIAIHSRHRHVYAITFFFRESLLLNWASYQVSQWTCWFSRLRRHEEALQEVQERRDHESLTLLRLCQHDKDQRSWASFSHFQQTQRMFFWSHREAKRQRRKLDCWERLLTSFHQMSQA